MIFNLANNMIKAGYVTPEWIADNIDAYLMKGTAFNNFDTAATVKFVVHYGLYCKTIKNLGTEKHH